MEKTYTVKVYDKAGTTFLGTYGQLSDYSFTKVLNGGLGALRIKLPRKFDEYNNDNKVNLLDEVQVWIQDRDTSGLKIYSGFIANIEASIAGDIEEVLITCYGYAARLGFTLDMDGSSIQVERASQDPKDAVEDVIDKYRTTVTDERINYSSGTTETAGFNISYTSNTKTCLESIERIRQMAGQDWWWYVDPNNIFYFKSKPTTPTHTFTFGKDVASIKIRKSIDTVINNLIFWNGLQPDDDNFISKRYYSSSSHDYYWHRFETLTDGRITDETTADKLGDAYIESNKSPEIALEIVIKDNNLGDGYDIESINPGDTCKVVNLNDSDIYGANLLITRVDYTPEQATVYVEDSRFKTSRSLSDIRRQLDTQIYGDGVATITSVDID